MSGPTTEVRYAVVGIGYFAQAAVLPAFKRAKHCKLVAIFSDDPVKRGELSKRYKVKHALPYEEYDRFLASNQVDAVYIALPNTLHADFAIRAAMAGVHVFCEKPMAVNEAQCYAMIRACKEASVRLMIGYRLHFERANLEAIELGASGKLGDLRAFNATFSMQAREGNIRLKAELGGGPLYDIGIYCINAARYLFRDEPTEVIGMTGRQSDDPRFQEVEEQVAAILRFPGDKLATFVASFGAADTSRYELLGEYGTIRLDPAFEVFDALRHELKTPTRTRKKKFPKRDQVAAELAYFSECILNNREPEPSGLEGLADVRIIQAIYKSARTGQVQSIRLEAPDARPDMAQEKRYAPHSEEELVHATPPSA